MREKILRRNLWAVSLLAFLVIPLVAACAPDPTLGTQQVFQTATPCANSLTAGLSGGTGAGHMSHFLSDYVSAPVTGAADVPNATFTNIFLYPDPNTESWNQHLAALAKQPGANIDTSATAESLNAITRALTCSSYFDLLTQYNLNPPTFAGSEATIQSCVDAAVHDAGTSGVISFATMRSFADCERNNNKGDVHSDQVNIFVSPDMKAAAYGDSFDMCSAGSGVSGYHGFGVGVPNWTAVPVGTGCNGNIASVTEDLSHEMVELVSDPAGLGWVHESVPGRFITPELGANLEEQYNEGELGDICSSVGLFPTPSTDFSDASVAQLGTLSVAPYWSDQDAACEPRAIVDQTLALVTGSPVIRFTGSTHNLPVPLSLPAGLGNRAIEAIELMVITGNDNLNSGSAANATVSFSDGSAVVSSGINEGAEWGNNTAHAALLKFPHGLEAQQLQGVTLNTQFGGGISGDNWDVNAVAVKVALGAAVTCAPQTVQLVNDTNTTVLSDGSIGLIRMTGSVHTLTVPITASSSIVGLPVEDVLLTVGTGGDDLRGGPSPSAFASATIGLGSGASVTFPNINQSAHWPNMTTHTVDLFDLNALPAGTTAGSLSSLTLSTAFGGGIDGDNWDVNALSLTAVLGCASGNGNSNNLKPITLILLQADGAAHLADGSIGLARLTGDVHVWGPTPIQSVPANQASLQVIALQVTITTGGDNLRGGSDGGDNATVTIGGVGAFPDVNQTQTWDNNSVHTVSLTPIPTSLTLGSISSISISTMFGGGLNGDNWDIADVQLSATVLG